jgi:hypothetical protein
MLAERVDDKSFLWLIEKWLKAGVLETDGKVLHPVTGTPQGGIVSPILANIYLHFALDLWFQKVVIPRCSGEACLIRYADDFVCAFEKEEDAKRFYEALGERLRKFNLELSAEKTVQPQSVGDNKIAPTWVRFYCTLRAKLRIRVESGTRLYPLHPLPPLFLLQGSGKLISSITDQRRSVTPAAIAGVLPLYFLALCLPFRA